MRENERKILGDMHACLFRIFNARAYLYKERQREKETDQMKETDEKIEIESKKKHKMRERLVTRETGFSPAP